LLCINFVFSAEAKAEAENLAYLEFFSKITQNFLPFLDKMKRNKYCLEKFSNLFYRFMILIFLDFIS
jgi:hypothetical protein